MLHLILLIAFILTISAYPFEYDPWKEVKITGGNQVDITNFPYQVAVIQSEKLWCGGSIISPQFVLTAAHCVFYAKEPLTVHAGTSFWAQPGSVHQVVQTVTYGSEKTTDVALLRISDTFAFDATRQPIPLSSTSDKLNPGIIANITGWGLTTSGGDISDQLMAVQIPISDRQLCNISYSGILRDGQFCAGTASKDSCTYDSGSPLVIDGKQFGIVSMGSGCGNPIYPGIYADVSYFNTWIIQQSSKFL